MRSLGILAGLLGLALVLTACAGDGGEKTNGGGATKGGAISMSATDFKFDPATINAKVGQEVTVNVKNNGAVLHDFMSADLKVPSTLVDVGKTTAVKFTPTAAGTFKFVCSQPGHEASGMHGTVTVS